MKRMLPQWILAVLVVNVGWVLAGTRQPEVETRVEELPWRSDFRMHTWAEQGKLALRSMFALKPGEILWLEVEDASVVTCHPRGGAEQGADTGGGRFVRSPQRIEYFLNVADEGQYHTWYRLRLPAGLARVQHLEGVDASLGASVARIWSEGAPGTWQWVKGRACTFKPGLRELQLDQWSPGVDLDRICLATKADWKPPAGIGPNAAKGQAWPFGKADTDDAVFPEVLGWKRAVLTGAEPNGGSIRVLFSTDGGQIWQPMPADGSLERLPVRADGMDRIRFRVVLRRSGSGQSPTVGPIRLSYRGPKNDLVSLEDAVARLHFARKTGALCGIENRVTSTMLIPMRRPCPVFLIRLKKPGLVPEDQWETVSSLQAHCVKQQMAPGAGMPLTLGYQVRGKDGTVDVEVRCAQTAPGETTWTATVHNHLAQRDVVELAYPIVSRLQISRRPADDTLLINANYLVRHPSTFGRFLYWWPTGPTAPLMDLHNAREGLTLVAHDRTFRSTGISCRGQQCRSVELSLHKRIRVKPGESFTGEAHILRVHTGDWHAAILAERQWVRAHMTSAPTPRWVREADGWMPCGWPCPRWAHLGEYAAQIKARTGFTFLQFWNFQVPGTTWTLPAPSPVAGSEADLRWGIRQAHRAGVRVTFYIQGLLYDPQGDGSDPDDKIGHLRRRDLWPGYGLPEAGFAEKFARRDPAGRTHSWSPTEMEMCAASWGFHEYKRHWAKNIFVRRLGADGIYWDSLARGCTCWRGEHGHGDDPGMWGAGARASHERIHREIRAINPNAVFSSEGPPSDALNESVSIHLDNAPNLEVVRMLYPDMLIYLGASDGADPQRRKAHLLGCRFDGIKPGTDQEKLLWIRRRVNQYLYPAEPRDTLGLTVEGEGVAARLFWCDASRTRGAVVNILNENKKPGVRIRVDTQPFGPVRRAWVVDADGRDEPLPGGEVINGGKAYRFVAPQSFASTVLLLSEAEPRVTVLPTENVSVGGTVELRVRVESLTGRRVRGAVRLRTPKGLTCPSVQFDVDTAGRAGGQIVYLPLRASDDAETGLVDIPVVVDVAGGPRVERLATLYVDDAVCGDLAWVGDRLRVTLANRSLRKHEGRLRVAIGPSRVQFARPMREIPFRLTPGQQLRFEPSVTGSLKADSPWTVQGEARYGGRTTKLYGTFWPGVPNGSLELNRFRDDVPDYWWGLMNDRSPRIWGRGRYGLDKTAPAADGRRSLRIDPDPKQWQAVFLDLGLWSSTRYKLHAQIRRTAHSRQVFVAVVEGRRLPSGKVRNVVSEVGRKSDGPVGVWETFETTFVTLPADQRHGCRLYLYNVNSNATVWFDDLRVVPLSAPGEGGQDEPPKG